MTPRLFSALCFYNPKMVVLCSSSQFGADIPPENRSARTVSLHGGGSLVIDANCHQVELPCTPPQCNAFQFGSDMLSEHRSTEQLHSVIGVAVTPSPYHLVLITSERVAQQQPWFKNQKSKNIYIARCYLWQVSMVICSKRREGKRTS